MPTVVNGVGTWYYGKKRIHTIKGVCGFCKRVADLQSYDTTLYFVVAFIPVIPLAKQRVLESCPYCRKHRVVSFKKWEASKAQDIARMVEKLERDPDDRDTIREALSLAGFYQDGELFEKLATSLARHRVDDAGIQSQLGAAYGYFGRWSEAEAAYRASLAVEDRPDVRQPLALALLKQGRPEEAAPFLQHILKNRVREHTGLIYLLIEGYQAQGKHQEALEVMDQRDEAFPDLALQKDAKKQRKLSKRYLNSGKRVKSAFLSETGKSGYREGSWTARLPRWIFPIIAIGFLCWYVGAALWIGEARQVYLLNGTNKPYSVSIAGNEHSLLPGIPTAVRVPEGALAIDFPAANVPVEPVRCEVTTSFFTRPFTSPTFVINPDQVAVLIKEEAEYAEVPRPQKAPQVHVGKVLHAFTGIDYEFKPFPASLKAEKGKTVIKTRVDVVPHLSSEARLNLMNARLNENERIDYAKHWLTWEPNDLTFLDDFIGHLPGDDALAFVRTRLNERPALVEWHRLYQDLMRKKNPQEDLVPAYRKLAAETQQQPDVLYLLARALEQDWKEADSLLRRAAGANPPSAYATMP
jgi:tetratricopeptide (TPR) repeat protein